MSGMAKPWRMRCQRSSGGVVRSMVAMCSRGVTVACAPSNAVPLAALAGACAAGARVLVAAIDLRVIWQRSELGKRGVHLLGGAFEEPPAAAGEERVAAEKRACPIIGNVRARVAGDVEHREAHPKLGDADAIAFTERLRERRNRLVARAVYRNAVVLHELRDAADVVRMMVRGEDRRELELLAPEIVEHRPRLAGVDDRGMRLVAQRPDVVVFERFDGHDFHVDATTLRAERGAEV